MTPWTRVLIANRGEIAVRIARTLRDCGIKSVAIYSDADAQSYHRFYADYAIRLPGETSAETYLNIPAIIDAITESQCDAVHPGYGFLSENANFAEAVRTQTKTVFIGPPTEAILQMGDKLTAKSLVRSLGLPLLPGSNGPIKHLEDFSDLVKIIGFPVILKAALGGGGRGMRVVRAMTSAQEAFEACQREAMAYFGNPSVFCERYIDNPRHIEFQILADGHGNCIHLYERDCSIQRRHQKLFEEAPSGYLNPTQRARLGDIACNIAVAVGYEGVGTIEFICESPDQAYFMEMNTRLQVEHPVTELITHLDLVAEQIKVAMGQPLSLLQQDVPLTGWAMEARINAENPKQNFIPSPGRILTQHMPQGPHVRVDTHIYDGYVVPRFYDSLLAKIIVYGKDRDEALRRMQRALGETKIKGLHTTTPFHRALLAHPKFTSGDFSTHFLEQETNQLQFFLDHAPTELLSTSPDCLGAASYYFNQQEESTHWRPSYTTTTELQGR